MNSDLMLVMTALCLYLVPCHQFPLAAGAPSPRTPWLHPCGGEPTYRYQGVLPPSPLLLFYPNPYQDLQHVSQLVDGTIVLLKKLRSVYVREVFGNHILHSHSLRQGAPQILSKGLHTTLKLPPKKQLLVIYENLVRAVIFLHMVQRDHMAHSNRHTATDLLITERLGLILHGGMLGGRQVTGGLYQVLCKLRIVLAHSGQLPEISVSGLEAMIAQIRHVTTRASRHNCDFRVITSVQRLLRRVKIILNTIPP